MKILAIHSDYLEFTPTKKAIKSAEDVSEEKVRIDECLVVFTSVESPDEKNAKGAAEKLAEQSKNIAEQVKAKTIVLYPYAHLSSALAKPEVAVDVMKKAQTILINEGYSVSRAPFGWYKAFEIKCKGHPLSELSRQISVEEDKKTAKEEEFVINAKHLSQKEKINLTTSLVVAKAIKELFPEAEIGSSGFYNDTSYVDVGGLRLKIEDIPRIESKARGIIKQGLKITKAGEADIKGKYQKEIRKETGGDAYNINELSVVPLFLTPYAESTKEIGAFKVLNLASAYWKNSAKNPQLVRIYSVGFETSEELLEYEKKLSEAEKRDHRNIGKDLDLLYFHEYAPGAPFFLKKGAVIYNILIDFIRKEYEKRGYDEVITPQLYNKKLWEVSGHWDHYKENMFITNIEGQEHSLKPMNCPSHCLIYKRSVKSYKDLPIRIADFCNLHRNELSGTLSGLFRVRKFAQDDGHIFCRFDQIEDEVGNVLDFIEYVWKEVFGFKLNYYLSTKPEKALGTKETWDKAEALLANALKNRGIKYGIKEGDGAFYGPKIDMEIEDALGRTWQCPTCQLDFNLPQRFELSYEGEDGKRHQPVMIHRAVLGSLERFFGIMTEHFSGKFPLWLSPIQAEIVTVTDRNVEFAKKIIGEMKAKGIRAELDSRSETIGKKVRDAQAQKINYIITIGDKEVENNTLAVRTRAGEVRFGVEPEEFLEELVSEIEKREIK